MELNDNQSALVLTESEDGEISVDVASSDLNGLTGSICQAIAKMMMGNEQFQNDLMDMIDEL